MKIISLFFLVTFSFSNIYAGGILKSGTQVVLISTSDTNSESGEQPIFVVFQDVKDLNGNILIAQQTPVNIEVESKKRKGVGKPGEINIKFVSTTSTDGQNIMLNGVKSFIGEDNKAKALGVGLGVGLLLALPMIAYIAKKGGSAEIKSGTIVPTVTVLSEYSIK